MSKDLLINKDVITMSSLEIAELCNKRHSNVLRDIRTIFEQLQNSKVDRKFSTKLEAYHILNEHTKLVECYVLPKDVAMLVLSKYSPNFTIELIKSYLNINPNTSIENLYIKTIRPEFAFGEDVLRKLFNGYTIIPQFQILDYRIDFYIPELKLAIEFDEDYHRRQQLHDTVRQNRIEKVLGCKFLRYKDFNQNQNQN